MNGFFSHNVFYVILCILGFISCENRYIVTAWFDNNVLKNDRVMSAYTAKHISLKIYHHAIDKLNIFTFMKELYIN